MSLFEQSEWFEQKVNESFGSKKYELLISYCETYIIEVPMHSYG